MSYLSKIRELLSSKERRGALHLLLLMGVGMLLETLGVGLIIPAMTLLTQSDIATRYPAFAPMLAWLGNPDPDRLVIIGMVALVGAYLIKTLFLTFLVWRQMRFVFGVQAHLSQRLFAGYLRQPYPFHLQRN